ncbi:MAG: right-handed parallel beta-helix repeat-containing protein [Phycisphaerae bacterium]|nr:right-handed parallel beta-helix repeat-containing protein [Phycisphaerae bacterium]
MVGEILPLRRVIGCICFLVVGAHRSHAEPGAAEGLSQVVREADSLVSRGVSPCVGFNAFHVQGLLVTKDHFYFTSVNVLRSEAWIFKLDRKTMKLIGKRNLAIGKDIHPGGIDFDGRSIWVPVAAYRKHSHTHMVTVDPGTLEAKTRFEVDDHIGAVACRGDGLIGANWSAEEFYFWSSDGRLEAKRPSPTGVGYQDCKAVGDHIACLGGGYLDWIDVKGWRLAKRFPVGKSERGSSLSREGLGLLGDSVFFLPDDGASAKVYEYGFARRGGAAGSPTKPAAASPGSVLFVAPNGDDANAGTEAAPLASLDRARDLVREMKKASGLPVGGVTVWLRGGDYYRDQSFRLTEADSGTAEAPIVYRAYEGEEVRLVGGKRIPPEAFRKLSDQAMLDRIEEKARGQVMIAELKPLGIKDYGNFPGCFRGAPPVAELFFNDERMTPAQWPNEGWAHVAKYVQCGSVPRDGDKGKQPGVFEYEGDRPGRWRPAGGVWLHGYWCFDWYDEVIKVASIDKEKRQITFVSPHIYGFRNGNPPPRRYRAVNLLEELDAPGEYFVDGKAGALVFWPPAAIGGARIVVSTLVGPVVLMSDVSYVTLRGLTVEACRGGGIAVGGTGRGNQIVGCVVRNTGQDGIRVAGGEKHVVRSCDIHDTGTSGLTLSGGDRKTLTPAGHRAANNHIWRFSRRQRTYASAIHIGGVGNRLEHNLIHDAPHIAIALAGNDHVIEYNVIHHVCMETDDCGAFYMGRNPSNRGNMIRYNFWHHVGSPRGHGNNAIYFDDGDGGNTVFGNVLFRCGEPAKGTMGAVFCHGGHGNLVENNVFIECKRAIGASPWNDARWKKMIDEELWQTRLLKEVDITKPPFITRYPELKGFMTPSGEPRMNRAARNVAVMCGEFIRGNYVAEDNLVTDKDPGFVDMARGRFGFRDGSEAYKGVPGLRPIPFDRIGLVKDDVRSRLPEAEWTYDPPRPLPPLRPR